eukprot:SAG31_NODE_33189_length_346_cov_21.963563_1_plen_45_part_10
MYPALQLVHVVQPEMPVPATPFAHVHVRVFATAPPPMISKTLRYH